MLLLSAVCFVLLSSYSIALIVPNGQTVILTPPLSIATVDDLTSNTQTQAFDEKQCATVTDTIFCTHGPNLYAGSKYSSHLVFYWQFLDHGQIGYGPFTTEFDQPVKCILGGAGGQSLLATTEFNEPGVVYPTTSQFGYTLENVGEAIISGPNSISMQGGIVRKNPDVVRVLTACAPSVGGNNVPDCSAATASVVISGVGKHDFSTVSVVVPDADGDSVTVSFSAVFQNEPTNGDNDGNTCPDAKISPSGNSAEVRVERSGVGSGRIYVLDFSADDGQGGSCIGTVSVCIPLNGNQQQTCPVSSATVDSTLCSTF